MVNALRILRYIVGGLVTTINIGIIGVALNQLLKSRVEFSNFAAHKYKLLARMLNFVTSIFFLMLGLTAVDTWIWGNLQVPTAIHILQILLRVFIDLILMCSTVILGWTLTRSYSLLLLKTEDQPCLKISWYSVPVIEALAIITSIVVVIITGKWTAFLIAFHIRNGIAVAMSILMSSTLFYFTCGAANRSDLSIEEQFLSKRARNLGFFWLLFGFLCLLAFAFQLRGGITGHDKPDKLLLWTKQDDTIIDPVPWAQIVAMWIAQWILLSMIIRWVWTASSESASFGSSTRGWIGSTSKFTESPYEY